MVMVVSCPSCGAPISHGVAACPYCRVALSWPGAPPAAGPAAPATPEAPAGVVEQLRGGNKIMAIRTYHKATGCSLGDAKRFVDDLERELGLT